MDFSLFFVYGHNYFFPKLLLSCVSNANKLRIFYAKKTVKRIPVEPTRGEKLWHGRSKMRMLFEQICLVSSMCGDVRAEGSRTSRNWYQLTLMRFVLIFSLRLCGQILMKRRFSPNEQTRKRFWLCNEYRKFNFDGELLNTEGEYRDGCPH